MYGPGVFRCPIWDGCYPSSYPRWVVSGRYVHYSGSGGCEWVRAGYFTHPVVAGTSLFRGSQEKGKSRATVVLITMVGAVRASPYRWGVFYRRPWCWHIPRSWLVPVSLSLGAWKQVGRARVVLVSAPPHEGATLPGARVIVRF